jgi:CheY-like chemotaxis protein
VPKVLYLEDEEAVLETLPLLLEGEGIEIVGTSSIEEALQWASEQYFDAMLLDVMMPPAEGMDDESLDYGRLTGKEVAKRIKEIQPELPIVAFTILTDRELRKEIIDAGVTFIVTKPCESDAVASALYQVTGGR